MNLFSLVFCNLSYVLLPISLYLFYVFQKRTYEEKENKVILIAIIYSILYIEYKYGVSMYGNVPLILLNIPLVIAMYHKKSLHVILISLFLIGYNYLFFKSFIFLFILEYLLYYLFYLKYKNNTYYLLVFFSLIKTLMSLVYILYTDFDKVFLANILFEILTFYFIMAFVIFAFEKCFELFKVFLSVKDLQQNKQIKNSLFKISHEIKNPIAVCKGYLDMFDLENKKHAKKYIPILKEEINRTLILLEDFLSMNKLKIKKEPLDICLLLEEVTNTFLPIFKKNKINFKIEGILDEIYIDGDYNRLSQVIINIIKNSIEAKDVNKNMEVKINVLEKENFVYLEFYDNGLGISKENLKKISQPFFTTKIGGTGLGTSLSNEIIEGHNGVMKYESEENEYTIVKIELPLYKF